MKEVPKIGEYYHFWDDGKTGPGRHYICKIERIITLDEAKNIKFKNREDNEEFSLLDRWIKEKRISDFLYSKRTDYIIEASCPKYDEDNLYFVRTKDGGWFSMNVTNWWQSGRLDIDGKIYEDVINLWESYGDDISIYTECTY